jgi:hypothetical protein
MDAILLEAVKSRAQDDYRSDGNEPMNALVNDDVGNDRSARPTMVAILSGVVRRQLLELGFAVT